MTHHINIRADTRDLHAIFDPPRRPWENPSLKGEVLDWLHSQFGPGEFNPKTNYFWKLNGSKLWAYDYYPEPVTVRHEFTFKQRSHAMLFKLTWC